jgi:hypothetical protein
MISRSYPRAPQTASERTIQKFLIQRHHLALEVDDVDGMRDNVARMTSPQAFTAVDVMLLHEMLRQAGWTIQSSGLGVAFEDFDEFLGIRAAQEHLVLNAAKESFIAQLIRPKVGRKNQECLEGHRHFPPVSKVR